MTRFLVIGRGFLGRAIAEHAREHPSAVCTIVRHDQTLTESVREYDAVISASIDPRLFTEPYSEAFDFDLKICRRLSALKYAGQFYQLSSRKVYASSNNLVVHNESSPQAETRVDQHYRVNKLLSESQCRSVLGEGLTTLRLSNIFGFEYGRTSFFGIMLSSLIDRGRIEMHCGQNTRRDFLPIHSFSRDVLEIVRLNLQGTYNLGSGVALPVSTVVDTVKASFERGSGLKVSTSFSEEVVDQFVFDCSRINAAIGRKPPSKTNILRFCKEIGHFYGTKYSA